MEGSGTAAEILYLDLVEPGEGKHNAAAWNQLDRVFSCWNSYMAEKNNQISRSRSRIIIYRPGDCTLEIDMYLLTIKER